MNNELRNMLNMMMAPNGTKGTCEPSIEFAEAVFAVGGLDPKLRRMVILRVAKVLGASVQARASVMTSRDHSLAPEEIEATANDGPVTGVEPDCALVCAVVDELFEVGTLTYSTLNAMQGRFGDTTIRKLVSIVGWFAAMGLLLDSCRGSLRAEGASAR